MWRRNRRRNIGIAMLGALILTIISVGVATEAKSPHAVGLAVTAAADSGPTLTADPSTGLADWQYVKVSLSGAAKGKGYAFRQCTATPADLGKNCTVLTGITAVTDSQGNATTYSPVWSGAHEPQLKSNDGTAMLSCDFDHPCSIAAMPYANDLSTAVLAPIHFARSPDACPSNNSGILGSGSATAYRAIYTWTADGCLPPTNLGATYTVSNSHDGWTNFQECSTSFGVTGPFPPPTPAAGVTPPDSKLAPLTASGLVLAYRIYDTDGLQITDLTLTPALIAKIFKGELPNWNVGPFGQQITALNPNVRRTRPDGSIVRFPGIITPIARGEYSAETFVFTSWLAKAAPDMWSRGFAPATTPIGAQTVFPTDLLDTGSYKTGARAVALAVVDPTTQFDTFGNIGFMDSSTAAFYGLPTVKIKQADGSVIGATPATLQEAMKDTTVQSDGTLTSDYGTPDPDAYPMPIPSYMIVPTKKVCPSADAGPMIAAFLRYALQTGQADLPPGYAPLTQSLVNQGLAIADQIPGGVKPSPSPTPTPTPSPTLSPTPTPGASSAPLGLLPASSSAGLSALPNSAATTASPSPAAAGSAGGTAAKLHQQQAAVPIGQGVQLAALVKSQDSTTSMLFLPALALLGLLCLVGGALAQVLAGRRR